MHRHLMEGIFPKKSVASAPRTVFTNVNLAWTGRLLTLFLLFLSSISDMVAQNNGCFLLQSSTEAVQPGDEACINVTVADFDDIISMQYSMEWDASKAQFQGIQFPNGNPLNLSITNFGVSASAAGKLRFSWSSLTGSGYNLFDGATLFSVCLKATGTAGQYVPFRITGSPIPYEVVDNQSNAKPLNQIVGGLQIGGQSGSGNPLTLVQACTSSAGCSGLAGSIDVTAFGGTPPYSFQWTGNNGYNSPLEDIAALTSGVYFLTVTDAAGAILKAQFVVEPSFSPVNIFNVNVTPAQCLTPTGSVNLSVSSANTPLTYLWSNGATTQNINNLTAGEYTVTVIDAQGCVGWEIVSVPAVSDIEIEAEVVSPDCHSNVAFGSLSATVSGGTPPYKYLWSTGAETADIQDLLPGYYTLSISDNEGCKAVKTFEIADFSANAWDVSAMTKCPNPDQTGQITVVVFDAPGFVPPITYAWSTGVTHVKGLAPGDVAFRDTLTNLLSGQYGVTISDAEGCSKSLSVILDCLTPPSTDCFGLELADVPGEKGEITCMPLTTKGFDDIQGYQFSLAWDTTALEFVEVKTFGLTGMSASNFNVPDYALGTLAHQWLDFNAIGVSVPDETMLFEVCFYVKPTAPGSYTEVSFGNYPTPVEVVKGSDVLQNFAGFTGIIAWGPQPPQLRIGACTVPSDCSNDGKGSVSLLVENTMFPWHVTWEKDNQTFVGDADDFVALEPGAYKVTVTDMGGFSASALFHIPQLAVGECVWPGDADNNNAVNHYDALYIGLGHGQGGPARAGALGTVWDGVEGPDWPNKTPLRQVNYKNLDTDGDGIVSDLDTAAISKNWGNVIRPFYDNPDSAPASANPGSGAPFFVPADTLSEGQTVELPVMLGDAANPMADLYGVAFSVSYDPTVLEPNKTRFLPTASWLGDPADLLVVQRDFHGKGRIDIAIVRKDGQAIASGFGQLGTMFIVIEDDIFALRPNASNADFTVIDTLSTTFMQIGRVRAINAMEKELPMSPLETTLQIRQKVSGTKQPLLDAQVFISPNPVDTYLKINVLNEKIQQIEVLNAAGAVLKNLQIEGQQNGLLNTTELPNGAYFLKIRTENGVGARKFVVQH